MTTKDTLKALYEAFAAGNIPFILETLSEDFAWQNPSDPSVVPYGGKYNGREGLMDYFQKLGGNTDTTLWQVDNYVTEGDMAVAEGKYGFKSKTTGRDVLTDWTMTWKFKSGVPVAARLYYDTAATEKAFKENLN